MPCCSLRAKFGVGVFLVCSLVSTTLIDGKSAADTVLIFIQVGDDDPVTIVAEPESSFGAYNNYVGQHFDPSGQWYVLWDYSINNDPTSNAAVLGNTQIWNTSGDIADFEFRLETPMCPRIEGTTWLGATVSVTLQTNIDGGVMLNAPGVPIWSVLTDNELAKSIFDPPFALGSSGQGIATLSSQFGSPFPSEPSEPVEDTLGVRVRFSMTAGEGANFNTSLFVSADPADVAECSQSRFPVGDLNHDGVVNVADLLILLENWGDCEGCPADLTDSGSVGIADLLILLANWG